MKSKFLLLLFSPFILISQTQIGSDIDGEAMNDNSGNSVSLSADGNIVAIGAYKSDPNGSDSGHVKVFQNISGSWSQIGSNIDGESGSDWSGRSISLSGDGNAVAIGARQNDGNGMDSGHVRVYQNNAGSWTQIGTDIDGEAGFDRSGWSVSLSSDGSVLAIGAPFNDGNGSSSGHVRVYQNNAGTWTQIGSDIDGEAAGDQSGISVSLSSDGTIVAIGANNNDGNGSNSGHVRVFQNNASVWTQIGGDIDGEVSPDQLGLSVSLSSAGSIVAIGAPFNDGNGSDSGHVRVYQYAPLGGWTQIGSDIDGQLAGDQSGDEKSVSLSGDGNIVAIGARFNDGNGSNSGHVRIYQNISHVWTQIGTDIDGETGDDQSGRSVSLSSDGSTVAIGAEFNSGSAPGAGHVRVYDLSNLLSLESVESNELSFHPNPAEKVFNIQSKSKIKEVTIINGLGQTIEKLVYKGNKEIDIDVSKYEIGLYFIKAQTEKSTETIKLIRK